MSLVTLKKRGQTGIVTLNNPPLNLLNGELLKELVARITEAGKDKGIKCLAITGGENFSAGANLKVFANLNSAKAGEVSKAGNAAVNAMLNFKGPVVAAINGYCMGGGLELALGCDIRIANKKSSFSQPEAKLGFIPGFGATQLLPRVVGEAKAKEMLFTANFYSAQEAEAIRLVNKTVSGDALKEALKLCEGMNKKSRNALALAKELVADSFEMKLREGMAKEKNLFASCFSTEDMKEGVRAFLEKREPRF